MEWQLEKQKFDVPNKSTVDIFQQDSFHIGTLVAKNVMILHATHTTENARYIKVVDLTTGDCLAILFK